MPKQNSSKGELSVLVPNFREFSPDSLAVDSRSVVQQKAMVMRAHTRQELLMTADRKQRGIGIWKKKYSAQ